MVGRENEVPQASGAAGGGDDPAPKCKTSSCECGVQTVDGKNIASDMEVWQTSRTHADEESPGAMTPPFPPELNVEAPGVRKALAIFWR